MISGHNIHHGRLSAAQKLPSFLGSKALRLGGTTLAHVSPA